tara:strand:- start:293 stop:754 length:462 start_codon:yes stop_codon:yes gene_type:complete
MKQKTEEALQSRIVKNFTNKYCLKHHKPRYVIFSVRNEGSNISVKVIKGICYEVLKNLTNPNRIKSLVSKLIDHLTGNSIGGAIARSLGVLSGVSDLIVLLENKTLFIELKNGSSGRQSKSQKEFQARVESLGFKYHLCRTEEEFLQIIETYV